MLIDQTTIYSKMYSWTETPKLKPINWKPQTATHKMKSTNLKPTNWNPQMSWNLASYFTSAETCI